MFATLAFVAGLFVATGYFLISRRSSHVVSTPQTDDLNRKLLNAIDALDERVMLLDADDRMVYCNSAFRQTNREIEDLLVPGAAYSDLLRAGAKAGLAAAPDSEIDSWVQSRLDRLHKPMEPLEAQYRNGRWISVSEQKLEDGGTIILVGDITERKTTEQALAESEGRLRGIFSNLPSVIHLKDADGTFQLANDRFKEWFGITPSAYFDQKTEAHFPAEFMDAVADQERKVYETGESVTIELEAVFADGAKHQFLNTKFPIHDQNETITGICTVATDITERRRMEQALRDSEARLRGVFDNTPVCLNLKDTEGRYLLINKPYEAWLGISAEAVIDKKAEEFLPAGDELHSLTDTERRVMETGEVVEREVRVNRPGGRIYDRILIKFPVKDDSDQVTAIGTVAIDISERKAAEEALEKAMAEAQAANFAKTEFLANMSHELRTPLNAIIGFSEIMAGETFGPMANERYHGYANDIASSGFHLLNLINEILDVARIERGRVELDKRLIDVPTMVRDCKRMVVERAKREGVELSSRISKGADSVWADPVRLNQIVINLLENAVKFTPEGGRVSLIVKRDDEGWTHFAVSDTGIGIAAKDLNRVLEPFIQVDRAVRGNQEGTGLGLTLSKTLVELHDGHFKLSSEFGVGTKVDFSLPPQATGEFDAAAIVVD
ncbi:MAG: PAS domain S-box protein [Rhodospirillaceae bacterium]|nr:PAS domain S-box protein [Rhodospirillaceae bacterium]MBT6137596.1 PAS domain S-box protein [Rhodospirillaceae bacterium]